MTGLTVGRTYHYRVIAANGTGSTAGADRTFSTAAPAPSAYRAAVLGTAGLIAYWRLGEATGSVAADEKGANPGGYSGGLTLGDPGALAGDADASAQFDGVNGEMTPPRPDWRRAEPRGLVRAGAAASLSCATTRDGNGWTLAYDNAGASVTERAATPSTPAGPPPRCEAPGITSP